MFFRQFLCPSVFLFVNAKRVMGLGLWQLLPLKL